jgi:hypothetical protein
MRGRRVAALVLALCMAVVVAGCGSGSTPAAAPTPPKVPGQATGPDLANVTLPDFTMPLVTGGVSTPNPKLTPGAVTTTDTTTICLLPDHLASTAISPAKQQAVFTEYGLNPTLAITKYDIDYLVPISLGGATTMANMWPAAYKGTGFFDKDQLDHVLRDLVCHRELSLRTAQRDLEQNWYLAWLKYVVSTGRA